MKKRGKRSKVAVSLRALAVDTLTKWLSQKREVRIDLQNLAAENIQNKSLSAKDKGLYWELVFGTVRWLRLLRWHLDKYVKKFSKLPIEVQAVLLIGAYQIIFLSRIPYFSAVNESVEIVKKRQLKWATGLVNASLRRLAGGNKKVILEGDDAKRLCTSTNMLNCLSNLTSHPHFMVKKWKENWGLDKCIEILVENNKRPGLCLRINSLKTNRDAFIKILNDKGIKGRKGDISPLSIWLDDYRGNIEDIPGFNHGLFQVQDEASQMAVELLRPEPHDKILDVCAGVGGKTTYLAQLLNGKGQVVATDINRSRLKKLKENANRLDLHNITLFTLPTDQDKIEALAPFDKILIDAPCSGLGVIRRHPDIKWNRTPEILKKFPKRQIDLLANWSRLLKKDGFLLYCVCTFCPEETVGVIRHFLLENREFELLDASLYLPKLPKDLILNDKMILSLPGQHGLDGFFCCLLKKIQ